jgi:hypothetical protein
MIGVCDVCGASTTVYRIIYPFCTVQRCEECLVQPSDLHPKKVEEKQE